HRSRGEGFNARNDSHQQPAWHGISSEGRSYREVDGTKGDGKGHGYGKCLNHGTNPELLAGFAVGLDSVRLNLNKLSVLRLQHFHSLRKRCSCGHRPEVAEGF